VFQNAQSSLLILTVIILLGACKTNPSSIQPKPTDLIGQIEDDENKAQKRIDYYESMHLAAPNVNWKEMDRQTRAEKMDARAEKYGHKRLMENSALDTFGYGDFVGKWSEIGPNNVSGRVLYVDRHPGTGKLYIGTEGDNIWKGNADGTNWEPLNEYLFIGNPKYVRVIPHNGGYRIVVASGSSGVQGFYYSDDDGLTWQTTTGLQNMISWGSIRHAYVSNDAQRTIYLLGLEYDYANGHGVETVYRSIDHGTSFQRTADYNRNVFGNDRYAVWSDPNGEIGKSYFIENENFYELDANGVPQQIGTLPIANAGKPYITGVEKTSGTILYVGIRYGAGTDFYRSPDGGVTWSKQGFTDQKPFGEYSVCVSREFPTIVYMGRVDLYRSMNSGLSFGKVNHWGDYYGDPLNNLHADIPSVQTFNVAGKDHFYVCTDGGIYESTDLIFNVTNLSMNSLRNSELYSTYSYRPNPDIIYSGTQDQGFQRSTTLNGDIWDFNQRISGDYGQFVSQNDGKDLWCVYPGFTMLTRDANGSDRRSLLDFEGHNYNWIPPTMEDPNDPMVMYLGGGDTSTADGAHIFKVQYLGGLQQEIMPHDFSDGSSRISSMAYSPIDNNHWYVMTTTGQFWHSPDAGVTWTESANSPGISGHYFYGTTIVPSKSKLGRVHIAGSGYSGPGVQFSENHGANFQSRVLGLPSTLVFDIAATANDSILFAATEVGPYIYFAHRFRWFEMNGANAPDQIYWDLDLIEDQEMIRFGTHGRGIWEMNWSQDIFSSVRTTPIISSIGSVFPNPASNGSITLEDEKLSDGKYTARIFSSLGQLVYRESINWVGGQHKIKINLTSGQYFMQLTSAENQSTLRFQVSD